jgi:hypothetical protein
MVFLEMERIMHFYILTKIATRRQVKADRTINDISTRVDAVFAWSAAEAVGIGTGNIKEIFTPNDGWENHTVFANELTPDQITEAYKKVVLHE